MKKINTTNEKDRTICFCCKGKIRFYYQQGGKGEQIWLFDIPYSPSVLCFFRKHGRIIDSYGHSLTVGQIYSLKQKAYTNAKVSRIFDRLPNAINYVLAYA